MYAISSTIMKQPRKAFVVPEARGPMIGRNLIRNCLLVAITSLTLAMAAPGQERTESVLTLDQATELARSHNRELKQAGLEIHKQQEAFSEARTQLYPRFDTYFLGSELLTPLDFTIKSGTLGTFPATGPIPAKDSVIHTPARPVAIASVTVTQPLTQLLRIDLSIRQQRLATELSQQSYLEHQQVLVNEGRHAYYAILESQSEVESQRALLAYLKELQQLTARRLQQEAVLKADSLRITAQRTNALYQLTVDNVRDQVLQEVHSTFRRLREARELLTAAQAARDAEAEKLRNEMDAYSHQTVVLSDLLQQQSSVASAEDQYRQGLLAFWKARADFERALGEE